MNDKIIQKLKKLEHILNNKSGEEDEKFMIVKYLTGNEKVLEIGANIGRTTMLIAKILNDQNNNNFVTLESDIKNRDILYTKKKENNLDFNIEISALSKNKLIQCGWSTIPYNENNIEGFINNRYNCLCGKKFRREKTFRDHKNICNTHEVNTISYNQLLEKYKINFDTLVIDCEGAFYYILLDYPNILDNIKLIIIENDFTSLNSFEYFEKNMIDNSFECVYSKPGPKYVKNFAPFTQKRFYEVWKKKSN